MRTLPRSLAAIGISLLLAATAAAAEKPVDAPVSIDALIQRLGDKSFRIRQATGRTLEERGEEALPALRLAQSSNDEEIRRRAEILTQKIERTVLLSPKLVTLNMKNRPLDEIVKELARQTGYKLQYQQGGQRRLITVEMVNATYWQALEKICNDGHVSPGFDDQQGVVFLYEQNTYSPYTYHNGPFRFVAQNFSYNRYVNLANLPRNGFDPNNQAENNNGLNFGFLVQAEPKNAILSISPPRLSKAEDENGTSLLPRLDANQQMFNVQYYDGNGLYRNFQHSTSVQLNKRVKDALRAKIIKGKVNVTLLSSIRPDVTIDKLAAGKKKYSGAGQTADIEIEEIVEQNKIWTLTMRIKRQVKQGDQPDYNWINSVQQRLELYDAKGRKYTSQGVTNFINNSPQMVHATFQFAPPNGAEVGPAVKLVLAEWLTIVHELDFEFKDLPLP